MQAKLTLRVEENLIKGAKEYARIHQKSLSQIVTDFFSIVSAKKSNKKGKSLGPVTSKLIGSLKGVELDEEDYKEH